MKLIDISGNKYTYLTVLRRDILNNNSGQVKWICKCDCGKVVSVVGRDLKDGSTKSCGCYIRKLLLDMSTKHGDTNSTEYKSWLAIKNRCTNKRCKEYNYYGGRGIKVCNRWVKSYETFLKDMGRKPTKFHSLDRFPNNNGNYEPNNCRWATMKEQCSNRRSNVLITYSGERKMASEWAKLLNVSQGNLYRMLKGKTFDDTYNYYVNKL